MFISGRPFRENVRLHFYRNDVTKPVDSFLFCSLNCNYAFFCNVFKPIIWMYVISHVAIKHFQRSFGWTTPVLQFLTASIPCPHTGLRSSPWPHVIRETWLFLVRISTDCGLFCRWCTGGGAYILPSDANNLAVSNIYTRLLNTIWRDKNIKANSGWWINNYNGVSYIFICILYYSVISFLLFSCWQVYI